MLTFKQFVAENWMYHGTVHPLDGGHLRVNHSDFILDRGVGSHFAADPTVAKKFAAKDPKNGTIYKTKAPAKSKLVKVTAKGFDQGAIGSHISGTVFSQPEHKELFKSWAMHARRIDEPTAERLHAHLAAGKAPDHPSFETARSRSKNFHSYMDNFDSGLHTGPGKDFKATVIKHYHDIMRKRGKEGLVYQNTSPHETEGARSKKSYIIFHPEKLPLHKD